MKGFFESQGVTFAVDVVDGSRLYALKFTIITRLKHQTLEAQRMMVRDLSSESPEACLPCLHKLDADSGLPPLLIIRISRHELSNLCTKVEGLTVWKLS